MLKGKHCNWHYNLVSTSHFVNFVEKRMIQTSVGGTVNQGDQRDKHNLGVTLT